MKRTTNAPGDRRERGVAGTVAPARTRHAIATLLASACIAICTSILLTASPAMALANSGYQSSGYQMGSAQTGDMQAGIVSYLAARMRAQVLQVQAKDEVARMLEEQLAAEATDKLLSFDPALIARIGTQEQTGHTICCPSFSCAYADAVLDGTVHDHSYYTCSSCSWTDWGGGNSSFRCVGTDEQLLREAYDQIRAGRPTVIHVSASYGEHWIALIGYEGATDPDHLALSNFTALDPWDGSQVNAGASFALYGDGCEHISER